MLIKIAAEGTFSVNPSLGTIGLSLTRQGLGTIVVPEINPVQSVEGTVSDGMLKISVNGIESGDIPLPEIEIETINVNNLIENVEFTTGLAMTRTICPNIAFIEKNNTIGITDKKIVGQYNFNSYNSHVNVNICTVSLLRTNIGSITNFLDSLNVPDGGYFIIGYANDTSRTSCETGAITLMLNKTNNEYSVENVQGSYGYYGRGFSRFLIKSIIKVS